MAKVKHSILLKYSVILGVELIMQIKNKFKLLRFVALLSTSLYLGGCSTPEAAIPKLKQYLSPQCYDEMTNAGFTGYQYIAQHPVGRAVFAVAGDKSRQVCAWSSSREAVREWGTLDVLALGRCETLRVQAGIQSGCRVFARNFDIVWDEKKKHGLE